MQIKKLLAAVALVTLAIFARTTALADWSNTLMSLSPQPVAYWPLQESTQPPAYIATNLGTLGAAANGLYNTWWQPFGTNYTTNGFPANLATNFYLTNNFLSVAGPAGDGATAVRFGMNLSGVNTNGLPGEYVGWGRANPNVTVTAPFSVEAWVLNTNLNTLATIVSEGRSGTGVTGDPRYAQTAKGFWLGTSGNSIIMSLWNGNGTAGQEIDVDAFPYSNTWTHVVGTFDGTNFTLYVNGTIPPAQANGHIYANPAVPGTAGYFVNEAGRYFEPDTTSPLLIGAIDNNSTLGVFQVANVAIYTNALSSARVSAHYGAIGGAGYQTTVLADNPTIFVRLNEPDMGTILGSPNGTLMSAFNAGLPVAKNYGTIGAGANGVYEPGAKPGSLGPAYSGFGALTNAAEFNGFEGFVDIGNGGNLTNTAPLLLPGTTNYTVVAWFKTHPSDARNRTFQTIVGHSDSGYRFAVDGSPANRFNAGPGSTEIAFNNVFHAATNNFFMDDGVWHMLAGVNDGFKAYLYLDGQLALTNKGAATINFDWRDLVLGGDPQYTTPGTRLFAGSLAHVALFTNTLSSDTVSNLYVVSGAKPYIKAQTYPSSYAAVTNSPVFFRIAAGGAGATYKWYSGTPGSGTALVNGVQGSGSTVSGAVSNRVDITGVKPADANTYFCIATTPNGSVTSSVGTLSTYTPPTDPYSTAILALNPSGYWPLDETTVPTLQYVATNLGSYSSALNGIYNNWYPNSSAIPYNYHVIYHPAGVTGDGNGSTRFGDSGQYVVLPHNQPNSVIKAPFSVEAWVYPNAALGNTVGIVSEGRGNEVVPSVPPNTVNNYRGFVLGGNGGNGFWFVLYNTNGTAGQEIDVTPPSGITVSNWYHLVGTFDGTTATLYVNGAATAGNGAGVNNPLTLTTNRAGLTFVPDPISPFLVGCQGSINNGRIAANIDEVAVYTNVLTPLQINNHYNATNSGYQAAVLLDTPVIYMRLGDAVTTKAPPLLNTFPVATNYGSVGSRAFGVYEPGTIPGSPGPAGAGFGASSKGVVINGVAAAVDIGGGNNIQFNVPELNPSTLSSGGSPANNESIVIWWQGTADSVQRFQNVLGHSDNSWRMGFDRGVHYTPGGSGELTGTSYVPNYDGNWHMTVGTFDGTLNRLYIDGVLDTSTGGSVPANGDPRDVVLGADPQYQVAGGRAWLGSITRAAFFNTALSATTISNLYNVAAPAPFFKTQPTGGNLNGGAAFTNTVLTGGGMPQYYRWYKGTPPGTLLTADGGRIFSGSPFTNNTLGVSESLVITNLLVGDSDSYYVVVTNSSGVATSSVVAITVVETPAIFAQNTNDVQLFIGYGYLTMKLTANGAVPLLFYWQTNGVTAAITTNVTSFTLSNFLSSVSVQVIVSNSLSSVTSAPVSVTAIVAPINPYPLAVLADKPVAYLRLDEGPDDGLGNNGKIAYDNVGGNNGSYRSTILQVAGYPNLAPTIDTDLAASFGTAPQNSCIVGVPVDFAVAVSNSPAQPGNAQFSIEAWVFPNASLGQTNDPGIITRGTGGNGEQYNLDMGSGGAGLERFRFFVRDAASGGARLANGTIGQDGFWHHLVGVCDEAGGQTRLYIDGQLNATGTITPGSGVQPAGTETSIGARQAGNVSPANYNSQYQGTIDEVAIYNYSLTLTQIQAHYYAAGIPAKITVNPLAAQAGATNANEGSTVQMSVTAIGTPLVTYQWWDSVAGTPFKPGVATNATLVLTNVSFTFGGGGTIGSGVFFVRASNIYGISDSALASVGVLSGPPFIDPLLPAVYFTVVGGTAVLPVGVTGTLPMTNQWFKTAVALANGGRISGAKSNILTIANAQLSDAAINYQLRVTNSYGPASTISLALIVTKEPLFNTNGSGWTLNGGFGLVTNNVLAATTGATAQQTSFFFNTPMYIRAFKASYIYQDVGGGGADGVTFTLQNDPRGAAAIGAGGGGLGYRGISNSFALAFNIYNGYVIGWAISSNGVHNDGNNPGGSYFTPTPVSLASGDAIKVDLSYDGQFFTVSLTDTNNLNTYSHTEDVGQIWSFTGGPGADTAFVGFTAATGGIAGTQVIRNFTFTPLPMLTAALSGTNVLISWPTAIGGYDLQSSPSLSAPVWTTIAAPYSIVGSQYQLTNSTPTAAKFYRLVVN